MQIPYFPYFTVYVDIILISQKYDIKMISQWQRRMFYNTLTRKGRCDDSRRPFLWELLPPYSSSPSSASRGRGSFFPKSGSILRKAVTTKVMVQHAMTMMKNRR